MNDNFDLRIYLKNIRKTPGETFRNVLSYRNVSKDTISALIQEHKKENVLKTEIRRTKTGHIRKKKKNKS
jgi:hypothetical protein